MGHTTSSLNDINISHRVLITVEVSQKKSGENTQTLFLNSLMKMHYVLLLNQLTSVIEKCPHHKCN